MLTTVSSSQILVAAITGTQPTEWRVIADYDWERCDFPPGYMPRHGHDVFAVTKLSHQQGFIAEIEMDLGDFLYVDCGAVSWQAPLEDAVIWHANDLTMRAARAAYLAELRVNPATSAVIDAIGVAPGNQLLLSACQALSLHQSHPVSCEQLQALLRRYGTANLPQVDIVAVRKALPLPCWHSPNHQPSVLSPDFEIGSDDLEYASMSI